MSPRRVFLYAALASASASTTPAAAAEPTKEECLSSYEQIQRERRAGHLLRASELTKTCLAAACPALLRADCESWRRELADETPSLLVATADRAPARAIIDGVTYPLPMVEPLAIDPGTHRVRVETGDRFAERTVALAPRERGLRVVLDPDRAFAAAPAPERGPAEAPAAAPTSVAFWSAAAVAVVGFSVFGVAALAGRGKHSELERTCGTGCRASDADDVSRLYLVADVALVLGLLASGAAAYLGISGARAR